MQKTIFKKKWQEMWRKGHHLFVTGSSCTSIVSSCTSIINIKLQFYPFKIYFNPTLFFIPFTQHLYPSHFFFFCRFAPPTHLLLQLLLHLSFGRHNVAIAKLKVWTKFGWHSHSHFPLTKGREIWRLDIWQLYNQLK